MAELPKLKTLTVNGITYSLAGSGNGGSELFVVTFTHNGDDYSVDKSCTEIMAAHQGGKIVRANINGIEAYPITVTATSCVFSCVATLNNFPTEIVGTISTSGVSITQTKLQPKLSAGTNITISSDGVISATGGGGGGGGTSMVTLTNLMDSAQITAAKGTPIDISFEYHSEAYDGDGICSVYVNDLLKETTTALSGRNTVDVSQHVSEGVNTVKILCRDIYGNERFIMYSVIIIVLRNTSTFDDSITYNSGDEINFKYTAYGVGNKTINFVVDGVTMTETVSDNGKQHTKIFSGMPHGVHTLEVYSQMLVNNISLESDHLYFEILIVESGNTTPLISSSFKQTTATQGELISIPFSVYDELNPSTQVTLKILKDGTTYNESTRVVNRLKQVWSTRDYPIGVVSFVIAYGGISKTFDVTVVENDINIEPYTTDMTLELLAAGRSNQELNPGTWTYENIHTTFSNMNWVTTGWVEDANGDTALRLSGEAQAVIEYKPFSLDARRTGQTIEFELAIRDVNNRQAVAMSCMNNNIGFQVTADSAFIRSEQSFIKCNYSDEEKLKIAFVIEPRSEHRMLSIYLNGILSGAIQYPDGDNFQQTIPANITIGSPYCSIDLYGIRVYSTALTADAIQQNYIADINDIVEKAALFEDNDVYDSYGNISYSLIKDKIPVMIVTGDLPKAKGDKKTVAISYADPENQQFNFEDTCTIDVQGTSSQYYVRKNWKLKFNTEHQHAVGQLPAKVFCMKADYAECTGTHNTQNANFVHTLYNTKTPAQATNSKCRTTVYGFPCVMFHRIDESSDPVFIGRYNFNFDKSALNVYGFTDSYPLAESWEFLNNTSDACNFKAEIPTDWSNDFEARQPDGYTDISQFKIMHDWVVSTKNDINKFKAEFEDYFNKDFCLMYYIYTFVMLMVDQRAKNMFLTTWDGIHWEPWFYDNDTCLGINNEGELVFDYYHEDTDQLDTANVYNGQDSVLWCNFRTAFADEIKSTYQTLRNSGKLTYEKLAQYFIENGSDKWSESVYNDDEDYKYVVMLREDNDASNLGQIRGSGESHFRYFMKNRLKYLDSKWYAADYADDYISLRIYTPAGSNLAVTPNADITVTPYSDMYAGVMYKANGTLQQHRAQKNVPITFNAPDERFNDTETGIYGASQISDIGDLAPLYCGSVNVSKATKLVSLKIGDGTVGYSNPNLISLSIGTNNLLKTLDIQNCPNLTSSVDLSRCPNIETIKATGSGITSISLPESGYLKTLLLPETITSLSVKNQPMITTFSMPSYENINTLVVEGSVNIPINTIVNSAPNLNRIRLINANISIDDLSILEKLENCKGIDEHGNNIDTPVITGQLTITCLISQSQLDYWREVFPNLTLIASALGFLVTFKSYDGTIVKQQTVTYGQSATAPLPPEKPSTAQYSYVFDRWSDPYTNVTSDVVTTALYTESLRRYQVRFFNGSTLLQTTNVYYGSSVIYTGSAVTKTHANPDVYYYEHSGWEPSVENVTSNIDTYAQFTERLWPTYNSLEAPSLTYCVGAAYSPSGILYAVYQDANPNLSSVKYNTLYKYYVYKSTDHGVNWTLISTLENSSTAVHDQRNNKYHKLLITSNKMYFMAVDGSVPSNAPGGFKYYTSVDDGYTWSLETWPITRAYTYQDPSDAVVYNDSVYTLSEYNEVYRLDDTPTLIYSNPTGTTSGFISIFTHKGSLYILTNTKQLCKYNGSTFEEIDGATSEMSGSWRFSGEVYKTSNSIETFVNSAAYEENPNYGRLEYYAYPWVYDDITMKFKNFEAPSQYTWLYDINGTKTGNYDSISSRISLIMFFGNTIAIIHIGAKIVSSDTKQFFGNAQYTTDLVSFTSKEICPQLIDYLNTYAYGSKSQVEKRHIYTATYGNRSIVFNHHDSKLLSGRQL